VRAEVKAPRAGSGRDRVAVDPGTTVVLTVQQMPPGGGGSWVRQSGLLPSATKTTPDGELEFVMDIPGTYAGTYLFKSGQQESNPVTVLRRQSLLRRLLPGVLPFLAVAIVYTVIVFLAIEDPMGWGNSTAGLTTRAYLFASATLSFALYLIYLAGRLATEQNGLAGLVQGADRRASTSKVQFLLWTFGVAFALSYIGGRVLMSPSETFVCQDKQFNCVPAENWEMYLILLGVPAASAVIAKGVVSYKVVNGQVQKTPAEGAKVADLATNDNGQADLADVQYLIFNLIAFVFVAVNFARTGTLVAVPSLLLALTSAGAATYVLNKSLQTDKPVIGSVTPSVITPGTRTTIYGQNLFPPGSGDFLTVKIGGMPTPGTRSTGDSAVATAPPGMSTADRDQVVTVVTAAQVETEPYRVTILGSLTVTGFVGKAPKPDEVATIRVDGLPPSPGRIWVAFGSLNAPGTAHNDVVEAKVPDTLPAGQAVDVSVGVDGRWSPPKQLTLAS
jgi:hypothetical protein